MRGVGGAGGDRPGGLAGRPVGARWPMRCGTRCQGIRMDFAEANQWVFYGMAIALGVAFLFALRRPGTRVTEEPSGR